MNTMKMILSGFTLVNAPVSKAWSKVCQMIIKRANEPILLTFHSMNTLFVGLGKTFCMTWPSTCMLFSPCSPYD